MSPVWNDWTTPGLASASKRFLKPSTWSSRSDWWGKPICACKDFCNACNFVQASTSLECSISSSNSVVNRPQPSDSWIPCFANYRKNNAVVFELYEYEIVLAIGDSPRVCFSNRPNAPNFAYSPQCFVALDQYYVVRPTSEPSAKRPRFVNST